MPTIPLPIHGGGHLNVHGAMTNRPWILILGRASLKYDPFAERVVDFFTREGITVAIYEPHTVATARRITPPAVRNLPRPLRFAVKGLLLLAHPSRWPYFFPGYRAKVNAISYRARSFCELVRHLGPEREIFVLTRSLGGRIASVAADEAGVKRLACMGYPFENPSEGPNPERYEHLEGIQTPFLILQGTRDTYGGREIAGKYRLSQNTVLEWIDTDHDFTLTNAQWEAALARVHEFFFSDVTHRADIR